MKYRYLAITCIKTGKVESHVNVTGFSERKVEKLERAMLLRINENYFVDDITSDNEL